MNKNFLVTVSDNTENLKGVTFICTFFKEESRHQLALFHISRLDSQDIKGSLLKKWEKDGEELTIGAKRSLERAEELIDTSGISIDKVLVKTAAEKFGKVKDILNEGSAGLYDAIILGQRASYTLQWVFEKPADELAQSIIADSAFYIPLWVCPEVHPDRKNVLVCVDGSESSYRAVDHAGYILTNQLQHNITLFHVRSETDSTNMTSIFEESKKILQEHGIAPERITTRPEWGVNVTKTILNRVKQDKFAAVALGLHGQPQGLFKKLNLAGGTTSALISKIEGASVWCCP